MSNPEYQPPPSPREPDKSESNPEDGLEAVEYEIPDDLPEAFESDDQFQSMMNDEMRFRSKINEQGDDTVPEKMAANDYRRTKYQDKRAEIVASRANAIRSKYRDSGPEIVERKVNEFKKRMDYVALHARSILDQEQANSMPDAPKPPSPSGTSDSNSSTSA